MGGTFVPVPSASSAPSRPETVKIDSQDDNHGRIDADLAIQELADMRTHVAGMMAKAPQHRYADVLLNEADQFMLLVTVKITMLERDVNLRTIDESFVSGGRYAHLKSI